MILCLDCLYFQVIKTDKALFPVKLQYVQGLDQVWVTSLMSAEDHFGLKVIQVITEASRNISHKLTSLKDTNQVHTLGSAYDVIVVNDWLHLNTSDFREK